MSRELTACILCNQKLSPVFGRFFDTNFGIPHSYSILACPQCDLEHTSPMPDEHELKYFYESFYNFGGGSESTYTRVRRWFLFSPLYRFWLLIDGDVSFHSFKGRGRLLDFGCNEGRGLQIYRNNGFEAEGFEINEKAATVARSNGFKVYTGPLDDFLPEKLYDVVVLSNVIEHVHDPVKLLLQMRRLLAPGGRLWINCPNTRSLYRHIFGRLWINWHLPFHLTHFSKRSVLNVVNKAGYKVIAYRTLTPSLLMAQSIICRLFTKQGKPTIQLRNPFLLSFLMLVSRILFFPVLFFIDKAGLGADINFMVEKV
jgi:SAM-dependent methyltransferase